MQKTYREDCISKKIKRNRGEVDKYLIVNNHVPIISEDIFKRTQREIARRNGLRKTSMKSKTEQGKYSGRFALTELLICGECGSPYKRITWKKHGENRKVWSCKSRAENGTKYCKDSVTFDEQKLHEAICRGLSKATENRQEVLELIISNLAFTATKNEDVLDAYAIEREIKDIATHIEENVKLMNSTQLLSDVLPLFLGLQHVTVVMVMIMAEMAETEETRISIHMQQSGRMMKPITGMRQPAHIRMKSKTKRNMSLKITNVKFVITP